MSAASNVTGKDKVVEVGASLRATINATPADEEDQSNGALLLITLSIRDNILPHVMRFTDPRDIWSRLQSLYESGSTRRKLFLKKKLYNLRCKDNTSIVDHLQNIDVRVGQLANIGSHI
jgi:hypothetical protein